jgi:hypothetical protein
MRRAQPSGARPARSNIDLKRKGHSWDCSNRP